MLKPSLFSTILAAFLVFVVVSHSQPATAQTQQISPNESDCGSEIVVVCDDWLVQLNLTPGEASCSTSNIFWSRNDFDDVPGIYEASLYLYCDEDRTITFWIDQKPNGHSSQMQLDADGSLIINGEFRVGSTICYEIVSSGPDEKTVTINDSKFNTKDGRLFLISTKNSDSSVEQVNYDLTRISAYDIRLMAVRYPEITSFFVQQTSITSADSVSDSSNTKQRQCEGDSGSIGISFGIGSLNQQ